MPGDFTSGRDALRRCLASRDDLVAPGIELGCAIGPGAPEIGFAVVETVVRFAEAGGDTDLALDALERFLAVVPGHVAALEALIDVCGQTFYEHQRYRAQVQLADAHLALGNFERARLLSEQLIAARPDDPGHVQRLGRAMAGLGFADGERRGALARAAVRRAGRDSATLASPRRRPRRSWKIVSEADAPAAPSAWAMTASAPRRGAGDAAGIDLARWSRSRRPWRSRRGPALPETTAVTAPGSDSAEPALPDREVFEIDLSGDLDDLLGQAAAVRRAGRPGAARRMPGGLEGFFEGLRGERGRDLEGVGAALAYDQASEHFNRGEIDAAAACLRTAARDPLFRFRAASMLARIARDERRYARGDRVARARGRGARADGRGLAQPALRTRRRAGVRRSEDARALAVFIELQAAAPGYRDVADRVASLSRRQAGLAGPERGHS